VTSVHPAVSFPSAYLQEPAHLMARSQHGLHIVVRSSIASANYTILAQSRDELSVPENSPSVSMWPYLLSSAQTRRLNEISIYSARGSSGEQTRLLYMNAGALRMWSEMRMPATIIGESHRPPQGASLCFGMPFSE